MRGKKDVRVDAMILEMLISGHSRHGIERKLDAPSKSVFKKVAKFENDGFVRRINSGDPPSHVFYEITEKGALWLSRNSCSHPASKELQTVRKNSGTFPPKMEKFQNWKQDLK